jgi:hypothetical protein
MKKKKQISTKVSSENIVKVMNLLAETSSKLDIISTRYSDGQLQQPLGSGERSATEDLAHLLHCEAISSAFMYLALLRDEDEIMLSGIHPEREYGKLIRYELFSFAMLLDYFKLRRSVLLRVLSTLDEKQWSRALPQKGKKRKESVYWQARSLALHELEHLSELEHKLANLA